MQHCINHLKLVVKKPQAIVISYVRAQGDIVPICHLLCAFCCRANRMKWLLGEKETAPPAERTVRPIVTGGETRSSLNSWDCASTFFIHFYRQDWAITMA
jgi:hypothetical protein